MRTFTRLVALVMALTLCLGLVPASAEDYVPNPSGIPFYKPNPELYDIIDMEGDPIQLEVYSQLANYSGRQTGWSATLLKDLFNVEIVIIPEQDGTYATRSANQNLGDMVVWGANGEDYKQAIKNGLLLNWDEDNLAEDFAPYVWANFQDALNSNRLVSQDNNNLYGFGHTVASSREGHQTFMYSWDIRWDLYKQLGYPEIKDLDDLMNVMLQMKEICPTDEDGNETYGLTVWPDWDGNLVMYVKSLATAYYGYDELGFGHYNPKTGEFYSALDEGSPYMEMLKYFNKLYRAGLLDPNSMTQTYDEASTKLKRGGAFWGIFNYATSDVYNTAEHLAEGKMMYSRKPDEANPIVYGLSTLGGNRIWSVGAKAEYPEVVLAILDYFSSPEGAMAIWYGPRGLTWDYNEQGGIYFTELGLKTSNDAKTDLNGVVWTSPYTGKQYTLSGTFNDGCFQANNVTYANDALNPESKLGEAFNKNTWASVVNATPYAIKEDWAAWSGYQLRDPYMESLGKYTIMPELTYSESSKGDDLKVIWDQCAKAITTNSWRAIFAKADGEFQMHIRNMVNQCKGYDPNGKCLEWCKNEAAIKWQLTQELSLTD